MTDPVVTAAIVSGVCVAVPTIIATIVNNSAHDQVTDERMKSTIDKIEELSERVNKHNNLIERMASRAGPKNRLAANRQHKRRKEIKE